MTDIHLSIHIPRSRLILAARIAAGAAILAAAIFLLRDPRRNESLSGADIASLSTTIDQKRLALNIEPRTIELPFEKAKQVREAVKRRDFVTASKIARDVFAKSELQNWRYYPFTDFIKSVSDVSDPAFAAGLDAWVAQDKSAALPVLLRAQYLFDMAWFKRGAGFARGVQADNFAAFRDDMERAVADADTALRLDDSNPYGFYLKLSALHGLAMPDAMKETFAAAIAKYPDYYPLYTMMLEGLTPKWGGTVGAMNAFVERYAGQSADGSPRKLLYLSLYRDLLDAASVDCFSYGRDKDQKAQCIKSAMWHNATPDLETKVLAALQLYGRSDKYQFSIAVEPILAAMVKTSGADEFSAAVLQLAASNMDSDIQLEEDKQGRNNYVIDKTVALSWLYRGFYDNAVRKGQEALRNVDAMAFPSAEEKDIARAGIYQLIGETYHYMGRYADSIAYEEAAVALGDSSGEQHICSDFFRLRDFDEAVSRCTRTIEHQPGNLQARYWRASADQALGRSESALKDLTVVAASEDTFRAGAAIDMSMIYFKRGDVQSALDVLNKYSYLYDPNLTSKDNVAVSYNNRCYAYMQMGELRKALNDCSASLQYGSIPDAYSKLQELNKRLGAAETRF